MPVARNLSSSNSCSWSHTLAFCQSFNRRQQVAPEPKPSRVGKRLRLIRLTGYCPEPNPDELLNQDVKTNALGKSRPTSKADMIGTVRRHLHRRQKEPHVIRNLFKEKHVRYAA